MLERNISPPKSNSNKINGLTIKNEQLVVYKRKLGDPSGHKSQSDTSFYHNGNVSDKVNWKCTGSLVTWHYGGYHKRPAPCRFDCLRALLDL